MPLIAAYALLTARAFWLHNLVDHETTGIDNQTSRTTLILWKRPAYDIDCQNIHDGSSP